MTETTWFVLAIIIYMFAMLAIGYWSYRRTDKYDDYVLADRSLNPFVAALSAGASDMSGWLLMGLPGALFVSGLSELWIAIGLLIGCYASWSLVAPRLRSYSEVSASITLPSFFENRLHDRSRALRVVSAAIIIVFFTFYVSSGMVSGGRYFEATFGGDYLTGMIIIAAVTVGYTFIGGFLAVSLTDVVQGLIMFTALLIVPAMALIALDDPWDIFTWATHHDYGPHTGGTGNPAFFSLVGGTSLAAIVSNLAWGLGYFGQPHIVVRYMALRTPAEAKGSRRIGIAWMTLCIVGVVASAVVATVFFAQNPEISVTDQTNFETIFLDMGRILFHPLIAGLVLTAVLAAIMSTMSSQLLVVSSSLIEDLYRIFAKKKPAEHVLINLSPHGRGGGLPLRRALGHPPQRLDPGAGGLRLVRLRLGLRPAHALRPVLAAPELPGRAGGHDYRRRGVLRLGHVPALRRPLRADPRLRALRPGHLAGFPGHRRPGAVHPRGVPGGHRARRPGVGNRPAPGGV